MILLAIFVAFKRKSSDTIFKAIIGDLPALIFIEFMLYSYERSLGIREVVYLYYLTKDPTSFFMFAIDKHILFHLILVNILSVAEVSANERIKVGSQLKCIKLIVLPDLKSF